MPSDDNLPNLEVPYSHLFGHLLPLPPGGYFFLWLLCALRSCLWSWSNPIALSFIYLYAFSTKSESLAIHFPEHLAPTSNGSPTTPLSYHKVHRSGCSFWLTSISPLNQTPLFCEEAILGGIPLKVGWALHPSQYSHCMKTALSHNHWKHAHWLLLECFRTSTRGCEH